MRFICSATVGQWHHIRRDLSVHPDLEAHNTIDLITSALKAAKSASELVRVICEDGQAELLALVGVPTIDGFEVVGNRIPEGAGKAFHEQYRMVPGVGKGKGKTLATYVPNE